MTNATRMDLPHILSSVTSKREVCGFEIYVTVCFNDAGMEATDVKRVAPVAVFCKISKHGSELSGLMEGVCHTLALALQYGVPWETLKQAYLHTRFGSADEENSSLLDGFAKAVEQCINERKDILGIGE